MTIQPQPSPLALRVLRFPLTLLVGEQLYWSALAAGLNGFDLVEGEWLGHRDDLGPVEHGLASTLLQFLE